MATHQQAELKADEEQSQEPMLEDNNGQYQPVQQSTSCTQTSTFFRLSAELRNMIYAEVLELDEPLWVTASRRDWLSDETPAPHTTPLALLQVCRAIRNEAFALFYASNTFSINLRHEGHVRRAKRWVALIGESAVKHITHLVLQGYLRTVHLSGYKTSTTRMAITRQQDRSIQISDCLYSGPISLAESPGLVDAMMECIQSSAPHRDPLTKKGDLKSLIETFASKLSFRESTTNRSCADWDE